MTSLRPFLFCLSAGLPFLLAGCVAPSAREIEARRHVQAVGTALRPEDRGIELPRLTADSPVGEFVRHGVLNHPAVQAAYYDWRAAVEAIAPARSLPDPRFTFEADITDMLMTLMPGLMFDIMTPGKRSAMGDEMTAGSEVAYRAFVTAVLRTAAEVRQAWIELAYVNEVRHLHIAAAGAVEEGLEVANADYTTGRGMGTLASQMEMLNEAAAHHVHHATLGDRLAACRTRFKSALGLGPDDSDPPWPQAALAATPLPSEDELWRRVREANPELGRMRAMVDMAVAGVEVARRTRTPDFALGLMADLKANPLMLRPTANLSLPVWREKIAATIAAAEARRDAAIARVGAEELNLAAELAQMLFMVRESDRMIAYIDGTGLPNLDRVAAAAEAGYQSGMGGASMIPESRVMALMMRMERAETLRQREIAATNLMLLTADVAPANMALLAETHVTTP